MNATRDPPVGEDDIRLAAALREALTQAATVETLAAPAPANELLELVVRTAARAIPAVVGVLLLVDRPNWALTWEVVVGQPASTASPTILPLDRGVAGMVALSGQPVALADAQGDPHHAHDLAEQIGYRPRTLVAVPIAAPSGTVLGVLELLDRQGAPAFGMDDMTLLAMFAQQAGTILEQGSVRGAGAALLGRALAGAEGWEPGVRERMTTQAGWLAAKAAADPAARRALGLAEQVATIAAGGEAEYRLCAGVLEALAAYVRDRPTPSDWPEARP